MIRFTESALPHRGNAPRVFQKLAANGFVPSDIRGELGFPELLAARWCGGVATPLVTMPETAMYEDDSALLRQNEVRSPVDRLRMEPETETARVQRPPQR